MAETRKIAAILVSDVVGYSRLAGVDEDRTLAQLRTLRSELVDPTVAAHNGRVVKSTGDGSLVEFRSVVDSVRCAVAMQKGMMERNAGVAPDRRIVFRVGIHLGDVVEESDGDLMGDGVNIAARLEGVAKPGAVCISEDVYRQVKTRLDVGVTDLGNTRLKNIAEPIRAYSLDVGKPAGATRAARPRGRRWFAPLPWLGASLTLGVGLVTLFVAAPPSVAPVASPPPVASLAAAPAVAPAPKPPLAQTPVERAYPTPPVREAQKAVWTAPPVRPDRPSPKPAAVANKALAASAPSPPYAYLSPVDREHARNSTLAVPPAPSPAPAAMANEALGAFGGASDWSNVFASPVEYERAHRGGWTQQPLRPSRPGSSVADPAHSADE
jgi:class 3 adenylate cyclase